VAIPAEKVTEAYWAKLHAEILAELEALLDDVEDEGIRDPPSGYPFCGCLTCIIREALCMTADAIEIGRP